MIYIGIDPDIDKCGYALYDAESGDLSTALVEIEDILEIHFFDSYTKDRIIRVEAGWLNQSNFHIKPDTPAKVAAEIGRRVGQNHAAGQIIAKAYSKKGYKVQLVRPRNAKLSKKAAQQISGIEMNSTEERDAFALLLDVFIKK